MTPPTERLGTPGRIVVAIPAKDEVDHLPACLEALDNQVGERADGILLLLNNCQDGSTNVARELAARLGTPLHIKDVQLAAENANAGHARRLAMEAAASMAGESGVILTTDADGRVDPDWIKTNMEALRSGVDAVAGWAELDPIDWGSIPISLHEDDARECAYDALCDELHALLDPDPVDPLPRHTQSSGASLAVTVAAYRAAGGVPDVACGEDRALVAALRRIDARIRHAPECRVVVSGRTVGRASGGMADTISRRLSAPDPFLDDRLEPAINCARRAALRYLAREVYQGREAPNRLGMVLDLAPGTIATTMREAWFGIAWEDVISAAPRLGHVKVATRDVARQTEIAMRILHDARQDAVACRSALLFSRGNVSWRAAKASP